MNKTIIINMNGIIFHIEEDAYEQLRTYMSSVKKHFAYTADNEEIVGDIENRIAEMFTELLASEKKPVIILKDVDAVIAQMGSVSDFELADQDIAYAEIPGLRSEKKLFRDGDSRVIGGICSGIGHYFDIDAKWIRLFFALLVLCFGTGIFAYLLLWILMPKAKTRADKMAMKGEKVNIQNFKRNFDEELEALKGSKVVNQASGFLQDLFGHLFIFVSRVGQFFLKFICGLIILVGLAAVVAIFVTLLILLGNTSLKSDGLFEVISIINPEYRSPLYFSAFVVSIIPLTALVLYAVRILFDVKVITRTGVFAMLIIWLTGLGIGIFYGARVAANFSEEATFSQVVDMKPAKMYVLQLNDSWIFTHDDSVKYSLSENRPNPIDGNTDYSDHHTTPGLDIYIERCADNEKPTITKRFRSKGPTFDRALQSAQQIGYQLSQKDSLIQFGWGGFLRQNVLWRDQRIEIIVKVPANTVLKIDGKLNDYLRGYDLDECIPEGLSRQTTAAWVMGADGLKCADEYVYKFNTDQDFREEEKRKKEERDSIDRQNSPTHR